MDESAILLRLRRALVRQLHAIGTPTYLELARLLYREYQAHRDCELNAAGSYAESGKRHRNAQKGKRSSTIGAAAGLELGLVLVPRYSLRCTACLHFLRLWASRDYAIAHAPLSVSVAH
jgi:hypothetical protein